MADTTTTTYGLTKPEVGASEDTWGTKLNTNLDTIDDLLDGTTAIAPNLTAGSWKVGGTAVTSTAAELNLLDGVTATTAELNYVDGVTSNIQTQLNAKLSSITAGAGIDVSGSTVSLESDARGDLFYMGRDTNDYYVVNTTTHDWYLDGVLDMRLENDGDLHVDGDVIAYSTTTSSDEKLKDNIQVVDKSLVKLSELRGVTFNWKKDGSESAGLIAQDVLKVLPCAVTEVDDLNGDDSHLTVNYSAVTSILVEAVKELAKRVEELEAK